MSFFKHFFYKLKFPCHHFYFYLLLLQQHTLLHRILVVSAIFFECHGLTFSSNVIIQFFEGEKNIKYIFYDVKIQSVAKRILMLFVELTAFAAIYIKCTIIIVVGINKWPFYSISAVCLVA